MNRKEQIEKVILKELRDIEFMKKIKNINTIHEAKKGTRPVMSGRFGAQVQSDLEAAKAAHGHLVNPDAVPSNPIDATKVYRNAAASAGGDAMDDSSDEDFKTNKSDAEEDAEARKNLEPGVEQPQSEREKETQARAEAKHEQIKHHVGELAKHIPAFADLAKTRYKTTAIFDAEPEHITAALNSAERTHPHLNTHVSRLRTLLGM